MNDSLGIAFREAGIRPEDSRLAHLEREAIQAESEPDMLAAALSHARAGHPVFPVNPKTKTPMISETAGGHGYKDATTDEGQIRAWWTTLFPGAAIGYAPPRGVIIIDADIYKPGCAFEALEAEYGPFPFTYTVTTPGNGTARGRHLHYRLPPGSPKIRTGNDALGRFVDVKGDGNGYGILPPSRHPSGDRYALEDTGVAEREIAPDWVVEALLDAEVSGTMASRRFTRRNRCPVCRGGKDDPHGQRIRCYGFLSSDATHAHCTREEYAGRLKLEKNGTTFAHRLGEQACDCGVKHALTGATPKPEQGTLPDDDKLLSISLVELDENPPSPPEFAIDGLVVARGVTLLFGKPFGGKSIGATQLGLHAAAGLDFLLLPGGKPERFHIARPLRVLYIDEEMGLPLLWNRIKLMRSGREEFNDPDVSKRFRVVSRRGLRLDDAALLERLRREISRFPGGAADVVILDTLRRMHLAAEKDSEVMARIMGTIVALGEEFGCSCLPIHHSKKGPVEDDDDWREAARGSGDLVAASQSVIGMLKTGDCLFTMRADTKAAGEIQPFPLLLDDQTLLFRRQSEDERFATKEAQHEAAIREATGELCRTLTKLRRAGGEKYPASWTTWRDTATGNATTLADARERLLKPQDGQEAVIRVVKRHGRGGGKAYVFAEDYDATLGTGSRTRSDECGE